MKFLFIDFEYANFKYKSICEMALIIFDTDLKEPVTKKYLINPNDQFDDGCKKMHGITPELVSNKPLFNEVWSDVEKYFINSVVVGHNVATSDLDGLYKNLKKYNISMPEIYYICTYELAKLLIPKYEVKDYSINSLCYYFNIPYSITDNSMDKLYSYYKIALKILKNFKPNIEEYINRFEPMNINLNIDYHTNASLKKDIHKLYGILEGFLLDEEIDTVEIDFLIDWKNKYQKYSSYQDIQGIINCIDDIIKDNTVTVQEVIKLKDITKRYLDVISTSPITIATQILNGIMTGISVDSKFNIEECMCLRNWLYENSFLVGHYPFDKIYSCIEQVLYDEMITPQEEKMILDETNKLLNPIEKLRKEVYSLEGKKIYLTGDFVFGSIEEVEAALKSQGFLITKDKTKADVVFCGGYTKELQGDGNYIREGNEAFCVDTPLNRILFSHIKRKGMKAVDAYKAAHMPKQMMSKLVNERDYHPNKKNLCAFAIALELDLNETNHLLSSIGYVLSENLDFDKVIIDNIKNNNYDIDDIENELNDYGIDWTTKR